MNMALLRYYIMRRRAFEIVDKSLYLWYNKSRKIIIYQIYGNKEVHIMKMKTLSIILTYIVSTLFIGI